MRTHNPATHTRTRRIPGVLRSLLLSAALPLAACSADVPASEPPDDVASTTAEPATETEAAVGPTATIRLVNLWVDDGSGATIDVTVDPMMGPEASLFEGVAFGAVSETRSIPADSWLRAYRPIDPEGDDAGGMFLGESDLASGTRLTLVASSVTPLGPDGPTAGLTVFYDTGGYVLGTMPVRTVDGALLVADFTAAMRALGDGARSLTLGVPGGGCLRPAGEPAPAPGGIVTSLGGTAVVTYDVPAGTSSIAAYDHGVGSCEGTPRIGPIDVEVGPQGRTYVFAFGAGPDDLRLVTVPSSGG